MLNLGLNNQSIAFEVALEVLGQARQPYMQAIIEEQAKACPSTALVDYCQARLAALDRLQDELTPNDVETVRRILDKEPPFQTL